MARTAKVHRLSALAVKRYAEAVHNTAPLHDGGGLYLRKRETSALWYLRMTDPSTGAQQWHRLFPDDPAGGYPHRSLADARSEARRMWDLRSSGVDPRAHRDRQIQARKDLDASTELEAQRRLSVRALFERWVATDLQPRVRADSKRMGRKDGGQFTRDQFERRVFPKLGNVAIDDVRRADLLEVLDGAKQEGKLRTANVLLTDLKQMFRFALARDLVTRNPLETVLKRDVGGASVERDRVLSTSELECLASALPASGLTDRYVAGVWLVLATGVRAGELLGATWCGSDSDMAELKSAAEAGAVKLGVADLAAGQWHILETKNQRSHTIHLSDYAVKQFERLAQFREAIPGDPNQPCPWVFPNASGTGPVGVKSFGKQLADRQRPPERRLKHRSRDTEALLLPGGRWTAHDLRRTAATLMAELGFGGDVIDECLNHMIESRVRRVYVRDRRVADQARAFNALGARLEVLSAVARAEPARTVPRARRRANPALAQRNDSGVTIR
jgi:integrase